MAAILCIDDDAAFCQAIADALHDAGHRPVTARTAGEGLRLIEGADLAIVDINLRGLPGDELVRAIREVRPIPVVLTSGVAIGEGRGLARACGARHFLAKPFDLDELLRVVDTLVAESGRAAS